MEIVDLAKFTQKKSQLNLRYNSVDCTSLLGFAKLLVGNHRKNYGMHSIVNIVLFFSFIYFKSNLYLYHEFFYSQKFISFLFKSDIRIYHRNVLGHDFIFLFLARSYIQNICGDSFRANPKHK